MGHKVLKRYEKSYEVFVRQFLFLAMTYAV
jgi:hypothetical protein